MMKNDLTGGTLEKMLLKDKYRLKSKLPRDRAETYLTLVVEEGEYSLEKGQKYERYYFTNGWKGMKDIVDANTGEAIRFIGEFSLNDIEGLKKESNLTLEDYEIEPVKENE